MKRKQTLLAAIFVIMAGIAINPAVAESHQSERSSIMTYLESAWDSISSLWKSEEPETEGNKPSARKVQTLVGNLDPGEIDPESPQGKAYMARERARIAAERARAAAIAKAKAAAAKAKAAAKDVKQKIVRRIVNEADRAKKAQDPKALRRAASKLRRLGMTALATTYEQKAARFERQANSGGK